jgi:hypothetical protein
VALGEGDGENQMWDWKVIALICTAFVVIGITIDRFLLRRQKNDLHNWLVTAWLKLVDIKIPNLPSAAAKGTLRIVARVLGQSLFSFRAILIGIIISVALTTAAFIVSNIPERGSLILAGKHFLTYMNSWEMFISVYPINFLFDAATILVTLHILRKIISSKGHVAIPLILVDFIIASLFAVACISVSLGSVDLLKFSQAPELVENLQGWWSGVLAFIYPSHPLANLSYDSYAA